MKQPSRIVQTAIILILSYFFLMLTACNRNSEEAEGHLLASAYDQELYDSELEAIIPEGISAADSTELVQMYVRNWLEKQLMVKKAQENLMSEDLDFEKQLEDYKSSLIIYKYERYYIAQKLDTIVLEENVEEYYKEHKNDFRLKENIIKAIYVKVPLDAPNIKQLKKFMNGEEEGIDKLEDFCKRNASNYFLDRDSWLLFNDVLKEIPIVTYNQENFLKNNSFIELKDSIYHYLINIIDFKIQDNLSPLSFEREKIKQLIIHKRKQGIIDRLKEDIYKEGIEKNHFKTFLFKENKQ